MLPADLERRAKELSDKSVWTIAVCRDLVCAGLKPDIEDKIVDQRVHPPRLIVNALFCTR